MKICLAPMEGITTYIYRNAVAKYYGGVDRYYTPFITASNLKGRELRDVKPENNEGMVTIPQILTNNSALFLKITRQLAALGYTEVNLNLGCPSGTVTGKGRGAGLLDPPEKLDQFLYEIFDGVSGMDMKLSLKTRLGMESLAEWEDILDVFKKYDMSELIIHPRLRTEFYGGTPHIDEYNTAVDTFASELSDKKLVFCYNGDIKDISSYKDTISALCKPELTTAVMVGRGAIMHPWLTTDLYSYVNQYTDDNLNIPDSPFDKKRFRSFINEISENYIGEMSQEKHVVLKMKELWIYWAQGLGLDKKDLKEILKTTKLPEYKNTVSMIMTKL